MGRPFKMSPKLEAGFKIHYNQPDIKDNDGNWIKTYSIEVGDHKENYRTRGYSVWSGVITRTNPIGSMVIHKPSVLGSINGFTGYNSFVDWCITQEGYTQQIDGRYWELDKDILVPGNKEYSEKCCAFVPQNINKMLQLNTYRKGDCPLGVHIHKQTGKFRAQLPNQIGAPKHLGVFSTPEDAHKAWQKAKVENMTHLIDEYSSFKGSRQDVADALLLRVSKIESDISSGLETKGWE